MDTLVKADIFFFITSIAVVFLGAVLLVVLVYLALILRDLKRISTRVPRLLGEWRMEGKHPHIQEPTLFYLTQPLSVKSFAKKWKPGSQYLSSFLRR